MSLTLIIESFVVYWHTNMTSHNHKKISTRSKSKPVRFFFIIIKKLQNYLQCNILF